jgi:hypothetical protein
VSEQDEITIKNICKEVEYINTYKRKIYVGIGETINYETLDELAKAFMTKSITVYSAFPCTWKLAICIKNAKCSEDKHT